MQYQQLRSVLFLVFVIATVAACAGGEAIDPTLTADTGGEDAFTRTDTGTDSGRPTGCDRIRCGADETCVDGACVPSEVQTCIDNDGDGFGDGCEAGPDCNDDAFAANSLATEVCDEIDNDCDAAIDEDGVCDVGCPVDECFVGALRCSPDLLPEACVMDGSGCGVWQTQAACGDGFACNAGECSPVGAGCRDGDRDGRGDGCDLGPDCDDFRPTVYDGAEEFCDGLDNNCNGSIDETFTTLGEVCTGGVGACERTGSVVCAGDGRTAECNVAPPEGSTELCGNAIDDDCDGTTDEGFDTLGEACGAGTGECESAGAYICNDTLTGVVCSADVISGDQELCGNSLDDDCDGSADEGFDNLGDSCSAGVGACERAGSYVCSPDLAGTVCNASAGTAGTELCGNSIDDDCDGSTDEGFDTVGTSCSVGTGACEASGQWQCTATRLNVECSATAGSSSPEACDGVDNDCDGETDEGGICDTCEDDTAEDNDSRGAASPASIGGAERRFNGVICFDDADWISVGSVAVGQTITVNLTFTDADGDLDLFLYLDDTEKASAESATNNEQIVFVADAAGTYYVQVLHYDEDSRVDYSISWDITEAGECIDDIYEENDSSLTAYPLSLGGILYGELCTDDMDWYSMGAPAAGTEIMVNLQFAHAGGDGDLELELYEDADWVAGVYSGTDDEQLTYSAAGGNMYARVINGRATSGGPYRISWAELTDCGGMEDVYEENDTLEEATPLQQGASIPARACSGDDDFYYLGRFSSGTLDLDATFSAADGDVDIFLWRNGSIDWIRGSLGSGDSESIDYEVTLSDDYFLQVKRWDISGGQSYNIRWDHIP